MSTRDIYRPPLCLAGVDLPEPVTMPFLGGEIAIFTCSSPIAGHDNEDAIGVFEWGREFGALAVADGVGGLPGGGKSSRQIIESLADPSPDDSTDPVVFCLKSVNETLIQGGDGSGTTISVMVIHGFEVTNYHVGDSASLIVGECGRVKLETIPHSTVGTALANSTIDEKTAMHHPLRHIVQNMIGMPSMWVEVTGPIHLDDRDTVILASDGLWDNLYRNEVVEQMGNRSLKEAAQGLVAVARRRMKFDSMSEPSKPDDLSFILYRQA